MNFYTIISIDEKCVEYTNPIELVRDIERGVIDPLDFDNEDYTNDINEYIWGCIEEGIISKPELREIFDCFFDLTDFLFAYDSSSELIEFDTSRGIARVRNVYQNPYTGNYWAIDMEETSISCEMIDPYNFYRVVPYKKEIDSWRPY